MGMFQDAASATVAKHVVGVGHVGKRGTAGLKLKTYGS